jgi:hypothetical protein
MHSLRHLTLTCCICELAQPVCAVTGIGWGYADPTIPDMLEVILVIAGGAPIGSAIYNSKDNRGRK